MRIFVGRKKKKNYFSFIKIYLDGEDLPAGFLRLRNATEDVLKEMNVKSGENVTAGQKIAEMGASGTNRTMLEFQVRLDGKPIDPIQVLPIN